MSYSGTEDIILLLKNCPCMGKSERKWVQGRLRRPDPLPLHLVVNDGFEIRVYLGFDLGDVAWERLWSKHPQRICQIRINGEQPKSNQPLTPPRAFCIKTTHFQRMHYSNYQLSLLNRNRSQNHASCLKDTTHREKNACRNLLLPRNQAPMHTSHTHTSSTVKLTSGHQSGSRWK